MAVIGGALLPFTCAQNVAGRDAAAGVSYVEEHAQPRVSAVIDNFLQAPIDLLQWSLARQWVDTSHSMHETEAFRQLAFAQVLSEVEHGDSHVTMIYGAFEDGRFIGYRLPDECTSVSSCEPTFVFRTHGDAPASSANWSPWALDSVNAQCTKSPACTLPDSGPVRARDVSVRTVSDLPARVPSAFEHSNAHFMIAVTSITRHR
eukprot:COSAG02_NODE_72_length_41961_cov_13.243658_1_plen_204_part_00